MGFFVCEALILVLIFIARVCSASLVQSPSRLAGVWTGQGREPPWLLPELSFRDLHGEMRFHRRPGELLAEDLQIGAFGQLAKVRPKGRRAASGVGLTTHQQH